MESSTSFNKLEKDGVIIVNMFGSDGQQQFPSNGDISVGSIIIVEACEEVESISM